MQAPPGAGRAADGGVLVQQGAMLRAYGVRVRPAAPAVTCGKVAA
ncbi:hypothetical protein [Streptomyces sp. NRRL S-37]